MFIERLDDIRKLMPVIRNRLLEMEKIDQQALNVLDLAQSLTDSFYNSLIQLVGTEQPEYSNLKLVLSFNSELVDSLQTLMSTINELAHLLKNYSELHGSKTMLLFFDQDATTLIKSLSTFDGEPKTAAQQAHSKPEKSQTEVQDEEKSDAPKAMTPQTSSSLTENLKMLPEFISLLEAQFESVSGFFIEDEQVKFNNFLANANTKTQEFTSLFMALCKEEKDVEIVFKERVELAQKLPELISSIRCLSEFVGSLDMNEFTVSRDNLRTFLEQADALIQLHAPKVEVTPSFEDQDNYFPDAIKRKEENSNNFLKYLGIRFSRKIDTEADPMLRINLGLAVSKYGFKEIDVPGNGDCFYLAVLNQFMLAENTHLQLTEENVELLRAKVVSHIMSHPGIYDAIKPVEPKQYESLDDYCADILEMGNWADYPEVMAISRLLNITLVLVTSNSEKPIVVIRQQEPAAVLYLGYEEGLHYQSLHKTPEFKEQLIAQEIAKADIDQLAPKSVNDSQAQRSLLESAITAAANSVSGNSSQPSGNLNLEALTSSLSNILGGGNVPTNSVSVEPQANIRPAR